VSDPDRTPPNDPRPARASSYAVAWQCEGGPRLVGSAVVDDAGLLLKGREVGAHEAETVLQLSREDVDHVELRRSSALPAVSIHRIAGQVVVELLMGGWGAAHDLADTLARPVRRSSAEDAPAGGTTVAVAASIIPGRRAELEQLLERGLPARLGKEGVEIEEACLGDDDLVLILRGPDEIVHTLARTGLGLHDAVARPRQLTQVFSWRRDAGASAATS
jgi:hypothetical protein